MKTFIKRITAVVLVCAAVFSLAACQRESNNEPKKPADIPKGRYVEEDYKFPMELGRWGKAYALERLENDSLYLAVASDRAALETYTSTDEGKTWDKQNISSTLIPEGNRVNALAVDKKGNLLFAYGVPRDAGGMVTTAFESDFTYVKVDTEGESSILPIKVPTSEEDKKEGWYNSLHNMTFAANGDVIGIDDTGAIYQVDMTSGNFKNTYNSSGSVKRIGVVGNTLLVVTDKGVEQYDLTSGKPLENSELLAGYLSGADNANSEKPLLIAGKEENELYFCTPKGLYRYVLGGTVVEQLMDGALNTLSSVDWNYSQVAEKKNGDFLILYTNSNAEFSLMNYTYSDSVPATPDNEITLYSLRDNDTIKQAITIFQKSNSDVKVIYEVGMSGKDAVSVSDALKTLNTEIMAGKGPDVLVLDSMPLQSYMDKGLLMDLSDVLSEPLGKGELFGNIVEGYKKENKIYAAPIRFKVPFVSAKKEVLEKISNVKTMAEYVEQADAKSLGSDDLIRVYSPADLFWMLYPVNAGEWMTAEGTVDKDKLTDFFTYSKAIYEKVIESRAPGEEKRGKPALDDWDTNEESLDYGAFSTSPQFTDDVALGKLVLGVGEVDSFLGIAYLNSPMISYPSLSYKPFKGLSSDAAYFIPKTTVGITVKTKNEEIAKKFVSSLFSEESQGKGREYVGGLPVNRASYAAGEAKWDEFEQELGVRVEGIKYVDKKWPTKEQFDAFKSIVESLDTPTLDNRMILTTVAGLWDDCMTGKISVEQAVDTFMSKVNLYLSE
jgi:ABC-type glycerol-3-phosphate transport system substrate-binding protein